MENKTRWYCQTCNQYFRTKPELVAHKSVHPHICKYCGQKFESGHKLGTHIVNCIKNPKYEQIKQNRKEKHVNGFKHSQQTKQKLSQIRKHYLLQNPEKHVWKRNTKFISKPCEQLKQFLTNNNINFVAEYSNPKEFEGHFYSIDIAFPKQKIAVEINGNQHYQKNNILKPDYQKRHNIIQSAGWQILEIHYAKTYKQDFRQWLLNYIQEKINSK